MPNERRRRYHVISMTPEEMTAIGYEGYEPFYAIVQSSLTFLEIDEIQKNARSFEDLFRTMAPFVVEWNARGMNVETNEWEPTVPAPADAGWEVFKAIEPEFYMFIRRKLTTVTVGGEDRKNVSRVPEISVELSSEDDSVTPTPSKTTRNSRSRPKD